VAAILLWSASTDSADSAALISEYDMMISIIVKVAASTALYCRRTGSISFDSINVSSKY
jgi:hypothetical protein